MLTYLYLSLLIRHLLLVPSAMGPPAYSSYHMYDPSLDPRVVPQFAMERNHSGLLPDDFIPGDDEAPMVTGFESLNLGDSDATAGSYHARAEYYSDNYATADVTVLDPQSQTLEERWPVSSTGFSREQIDGIVLEAIQQAKQLMPDSEFSLITNQAIDEAIEASRAAKGDSSDHGYAEAESRLAVQSVLANVARAYSPYFFGPQADINTVSEAFRQAACQLMALNPMDGHHTEDICYYALVMTFVEVESEAMASSSSKPPKLEEHKTFVCRAPECKKRVFGRSADLDRHNKMIHTKETRKTYLCDYKKCPRHKAAFYRQDHFRDHLRDQHKEDLIRRSVRPDQNWWESRSHRVLKDWWRCNRCLVQRVDIATSGYVCPVCRKSCEPERQMFRESAVKCG